MLCHSGLPFEAFEIKDIVIDDFMNSVRTFHVNPNNKSQTLVILHGYGGSGILFWKMIKELTDHYDLYLIDILGMGGSSRPTFKLKTEEDVEDFFISWME